MDGNVLSGGWLSGCHLSLLAVRGACLPTAVVLTHTQSVGFFARSRIIFNCLHLRQRFTSLLWTCSFTMWWQAGICLWVACAFRHMCPWVCIKRQKIRDISLHQYGAVSHVYTWHYCRSNCVILTFSKFQSHLYKTMKQCGTSKGDVGDVCLVKNTRTAAGIESILT